MGISVAVPSASSETIVSMLSATGVGVGGIFLTAVLAYILAYLNVVNASEQDRARLRSLLVMTSIPLILAFGGIVLYESLSVLGFI